jgi:arsenate reductase
MKIKVYEYERCSTCRKALKFLDARKVAYEKVPIVERPPDAAELSAMLRRLGGDIRKLFNTSGRLYREFGLSEKLKAMTAEKAIKLLSRHGKLVKRPFVLAGARGLVGFKEDEWRRVFG